MQLDTVQQQATQAMAGLLAAAKPQPGEVVVVGCSTSEVLGEHIGKAGSTEVAAALLAGLCAPLAGTGVHLAAQCCEHLNRALVLEAEAAKTHGWSVVNVVPRPVAGGSFATAVWQGLASPVAVEGIEAVAGLDIGDTLIGMHLRPVAVPVRLEIQRIGAANLVAARSRPKFIGGERAGYNPALL